MVPYDGLEGLNSLDGRKRASLSILHSFSHKLRRDMILPSKYGEGHVFLFPVEGGYFLM